MTTDRDEVQQFSAEIHKDLYSIECVRGEDGKVRINFRRFDGTIRHDTSLRMSEEGARALRDTLTRMINKIDGVMYD